MPSGTFKWPKKAQSSLGWMDTHCGSRILDGYKSTIFQYYTKCSFIYPLVFVLSLASVRLCKMCVGTIAVQKSTEGYVQLH